MIADNSFPAMLRQVKTDLEYFPGRFATAWRIGALTALMSFVAMFYGIPESAISCYLILFIMKPDAVVSMIMGVAIIILVTIVVGLIILILPYTLESIPLRIAVLVASSFFFLWLGAATQLGEIGSIIALVIAFIMGLVGFAPNGELATRAILYAWLMVASPMLLLILFNLIFGRSPVTILYANLAERFHTAAAALREPDLTHLRQVRLLLLEGQSDLEQRSMLIGALHLGKGVENKWMSYAVVNSYRLLLSVSELAVGLSAERREEMANWCSEAARQLAEKRIPSPPVFQFADPACEIENTLKDFADLNGGPLPKISKIPFFAADALSNPVYCYFALKTTLASVICYLAYNILDWQGIHTAMITCYVAVLGTTGETVHKLTLRIVGCLIGATLGMLSLIFVVPQMSDVGQLMIMVFLVLLLAAWVSGGNERIAYAGIQIGLAFLLTVLHGFSPSKDLDVATDRIIGILMGNVVIYVIFTFIWAVPIIDSVRDKIRSALADLAALSAMPFTERLKVTMLVSRIEQTIATAQDALKLLPFEPKNLRPSSAEYQRLGKILFTIDEASRTLFIPEKRSPEDTQRFQALQDHTASERPDGQATEAEPAQYTQASPETDSKVKRNLTRLEGLLK